MGLDGTQYLRHITAAAHGGNIVQDQSTLGGTPPTRMHLLVEHMIQQGVRDAQYTTGANHACKNA
jgi:hypothetical protein